MNAQRTGHISDRFRALLERAGLSQPKAAKLMGYGHASGIQRYLNREYPDSTYPLEFVERMQALAGLGTPPIGREEIYAFGPAPKELLRGETMELIAERAIDYALAQLGHRDLGGELRRALVDGAIQHVRASPERSSQDSPSGGPHSERPPKKRG